MNWEAVAAVAEAVGAVAVVATLAYLALQVKQNTRAIRAQNHQQLVGLVMSVGDPAVSEIEDVVDLRARANESYSGLSASDRERFRTLSNRYVGIFELAFHQQRDGLLSADVWRGFQGSMRRMVLEPYFGEYWAEDNVAFGSDFVAFVESLERDLQRQSS